MSTRCCAQVINCIVALMCAARCNTCCLNLCSFSCLASTQHAVLILSVILRMALRCKHALHATYLFGACPLTSDHLVSAASNHGTFVRALGSQHMVAAMKALPTAGATSCR